MLRFLSDEWVAALNAALRSDEALARAVAGVDLVVAQHVTGGPDGDRAYRIRIERGHVGAHAGDGDPPADVTFSCDWDTAVGIATGAASAQAAFMAGRLRLGGDARRLVDAAPVLAGLDDSFAAVRARTDWSR